MNSGSASGPANWPTDHGYVAKATPREGNGWLVNVYTYDPEAPDHMRLVGTTESPTLERLDERAWDFVHQIDTTPDVHVLAAPAIDDEVMTRVITAWKAMADAKQAEAAAARQVRAVVKELRALGLSLGDIAFLTHVSRGRVSQLLI